ncbi:hypothetical protein [Streptomyces sp. NPDC001985]|uniref:hypothetical protein n=1 Tax=Streptomyces sp. NPDC001985 TaxID=3154406 RepID=UPI00332C94B9
MRDLLLFPIYFLVFTPLSLLLRLFHDPLRRRWDPSADHYWHYCRPREGVNDAKRPLDTDPAVRTAGAVRPEESARPSGAAGAAGAPEAAGAAGRAATRE